MPKFIFISGGVISGLGKGIITSSVGTILKLMGKKVTVVKIDPYFNVDAGTMRPTEHGEIWVTEDGGEIDQDFGHYERFLNDSFSKSNNITSGKVYSEVISDERKGKYLGKTVQMIPHITNNIIEKMKKAAEGYDICLVEIGGTVGDYENIPFMHACKELSMQMDKKDSAFVLVVYMPVPPHLGEMKSKPAQHAIKEMRLLGINPDFIFVRSEQEFDAVRKKKIANVVHTKDSNILSVVNTDNIYKVPLMLMEQKLDRILCEELNIEYKSPDLSEWKARIEATKSPEQLKIAMIAKYIKIGNSTLKDSYISINEALKHAAAEFKKSVKIDWIDSREFEKNPESVNELKEYDGVLVAPGFGDNGVEGKISAAKFCRENKIPYIGICYGMQLAIVEFARNVCGLKDAHTTEIKKETPHPVIDIIEWQKRVMENSNYGASMRLGAWKAKLKENTLIREFYGKENISERHRHRYEVNPKYVEILEKHGMVFSGINPESGLIEFMELKDHPCFIGTQAHPEYTSRFLYPNPMYKGFIEKIITSS